MLHLLCICQRMLHSGLSVQKSSCKQLCTCVATSTDDNEVAEGQMCHTHFLSAAEMPSLCVRLMQDNQSSIETSNRRLAAALPVLYAPVGNV